MLNEEDTDSEDQEWILAFQSSTKVGEAGFNRLVLKHKDRIFGLCMRLLGDRDEADDAAQVTFVKVYHSLKDFRGDAKFSTWVYRIAVNTCKNRMESKAYKESKHQQNFEALENIESSTNSPIPSSSPSPAQMLESKGRQQCIEAAVNKLSEEQKILVILRDMEGRSYEEIVELTGLNLGTLKSRLNRGRAQLQEWLRELW